MAVVEPAVSAEVLAEDPMLRGTPSFGQVSRAGLHASVSRQCGFCLSEVGERDPDRTSWLSQGKGFKVEGSDHVGKYSHLLMSLSVEVG